jgi:cobalt-zinc-cadmium efflux system outer membrane protein
MKNLFLRRIALWGCLLLTPIAGANERPELSQWLDGVLSKHPGLQAAEANIDAARAKGRAAQQPLYNPELELEYEKTDVRTRTVGISQTIDWGDKRSSLSQISTHELMVARTTLQQQQQELAANLLLALATYQNSLATKQVADKRHSLMSRFAKLAKQRREAGDLAQIELDLARLATAEANFQRANAETDYVGAKQTLTALTGDSVDNLPNFPALPDSPNYPDVDIALKLDSLPVMRIARLQMDVSRAQLQLRQREQQADPSIGLRVGKEGDESLTGLTLSIPLHVRNNYQAEVDVANAELIQKQREAIQLRRELDASLSSSALSYQVNRKAWLDWQSTGKQSLEQQGKLLDRLWRAGELSTTDYLVQLKQVLDTEASAIEQRGRLWQTWIDWLADSGEIEGWLRVKGERQ